MLKEKLYQNYLKKFKGCFGRPVTEGEIIKHLHNQGGSKTGRTLFEQKYLPKLREMALVAVITRDPANTKLLKKYYEIDWKPMTRKYYIFTPKTALIERRLRTIIERFYDYLDNKDKIMNELDILLTELITYEITFYAKLPEQPKEEDIKITKLKYFNKIYVEEYGNLFDKLFDNERNYTNPESLKYRVRAKTQFAKLLRLLDQEIKVSKIFYQGFEN